MLQSSPRVPLGVEAGDIGVLHMENYGNPKQIHQSGTHPPNAERTARQGHKGLLLQRPGPAPIHTCIHLCICACTGRPETSPLLQSPSTSLPCPSKHGTHQERRIGPAWSLFLWLCYFMPMNYEQVFLVLSA